MRPTVFLAGCHGSGVDPYLIPAFNLTSTCVSQYRENSTFSQNVIFKKLRVVFTFKVGQLLSPNLQNRCMCSKSTKKDGWVSN